MGFDRKTAIKNAEEKKRARRLKIDRLLLRGVPQDKIAEALEVGISTVQRDIKAIRSRRRKDLDAKKSVDYVNEYETENNEIARELWMLHGKAVNKGDEKSAGILMKILKDTRADKVKILQSVGKIMKVAEKQELSGELSLGLTATDFRKTYEEIHKKGGKK